ncbi:unnamed protein product [Cyclocybe aegerita]|uniref:BRCT domain-containing protein n=1 Tax=Cyclocybe aegerita TaxID=1973307 RepID=A0A8S0XDJ3_CYCAE|nr:unnamed protein product [Cyclocybe aegerita]
MDSMPPSQPVQTRNTTLFSNADGSAIRLFADLWGIPHRAKLAKTFKNHGGVISADPREAQIILVDSQTAEGRQLIRDWGADANKTILEYTWVRKSVEAGKPLLGDEQWGDCLTHDDGQPLGSTADAEDDGEIPNPLPTPRDTPDEPPRSRLPTSHTEPSSSIPTLQNGSASMMPPPNPVPSTNQQPATTTATPPPPTQIPAGASPVNGINPYAQMQYPMQMGPMANMMSSQMSQMTPVQQQQMFAALMAGQAGFPFQPQFTSAQPPNNAFSIAFMDTLKMNVMGPWSGTQLPTGSQMQHAPAEGPPQIPQTNLPYPSTASESSTIRSSTTDTMADASPILGLESAMSRQGKRPSNTYISIKGKAKERSTPVTPQRKDSYRFSPLYDFDTGPSSSEKLFTWRGRALCFYVQIDLFNRSASVNPIKKNGGTIVANQEAADYVILYGASKNQKSFNELLKASQVAGKVALQAKFVHDCVEQYRLLDPTPYLYGPMAKRKRKRSTSVASAADDVSEDEDDPEARAKEEKRLKKNQKEAERRQKMRQQQSHTKPASQVSKPASSASTSTKAPGPKPSPKKRTSSGKKAVPVGPRPPTPPPEHTRQPWASGFRFSPIEDEYALLYAKVLLDHDRTTSMNAVATALHRQMPHHSLASWRSHFQSSFSAQFDQMRKRAGIAYRKALGQKESEPPVASTSAASDVEELPPPSESPDIQDSYFQTQEYQGDLEDDIQAVVRFFVEGNDDDKTKAENEVWARLEEKTRCKTASRWEEFYQHHYDEVLRRYQEAATNPES